MCIIPINLTASVLTYKEIRATVKTSFNKNKKAAHKKSSSSPHLKSNKPP